MGKTVRFSYDGKDYELGFDRKTAVLTESRGFKYREMAENPVTQTRLLIWGAFQYRSKGMKMERTEEIYKSLGSKDKIVEALLESYLSCVNELYGDAGSGDASEDDANLTQVVIQ